MKILVVEGEPTLLEYVAACFAKRSGHRVVTALGAKEALRIYHEQDNVDFILCGLTLDGKTTGVQLMRKIHAIN
jgi:CheY-like chemotaxis protein